MGTFPRIGEPAGTTTPPSAATAAATAAAQEGTASTGHVVAPQSSRPRNHSMTHFLMQREIGLPRSPTIATMERRFAAVGYDSVAAQAELMGFDPGPLRNSHAAEAGELLETIPTLTSADKLTCRAYLYDGELKSHIIRTARSIVPLGEALGIDGDKLDFLAAFAFWKITLRILRSVANEIRSNPDEPYGLDKLSAKLETICRSVMEDTVPGMLNSAAAEACDRDRSAATRQAQFRAIAISSLLVLCRTRDFRKAADEIDRGISKNWPCVFGDENKRTRTQNFEIFVAKEYADWTELDDDGEEMNKYAEKFLFCFRYAHASTSVTPPRLATALYDCLHEIGWKRT